MRVNLTRATAQHDCSASCHNAIGVGDVILTIPQGHGDLTYWHPACLAGRGEELLADARQSRMDLSDEEKEKRFRLLQRYAANKQRIAQYTVRLPDEVMELRIARLQAMQYLLRHEIATIGGVPATWGDELSVTG